MNIKLTICVIICATAMSSECVAGSKFFDVLTTEVSAFDGGVGSKLKFHLADADSLEEPCVVVPNVCGPGNNCFWDKPRVRWSELFVLPLQQF